VLHRPVEDDPEAVRQIGSPHTRRHAFESDRSLAEFAEIRQFASDSGWNVTDRQLWRYQRAAYRKVVKITERDRVGLLGRHLMQRRSLYARAIKDNDLRTALQVLRDEAELQGALRGFGTRCSAFGRINDAPELVDKARVPAIVRPCRREQKRPQNSTEAARLRSCSAHSHLL
jgi:hypothetical protein